MYTIPTDETTASNDAIKRSNKKHKCIKVENNDYKHMYQLSGVDSTENTEKSEEV